MGSQPSAYSAMCANSFGPAPPPIRVRGPLTRQRGRWTGFGCASLGWTDPNAPSYPVGSSAHRARISAIRYQPGFPARRPGDPVVGGLLDVPPVTDAEREPAAGEVVQGGGLLGQADRVVLGDQRDAGAQRQPLGDGGGLPERDERVERAAVLAGQLTAHRGGRAPAHRDVRVLGR
ncbi:hypothetical protein SCALM49S_05333 [Streptomyces californicus]